MEKVSDWETRNDTVQREDQTERTICFNCKQEVPKNTVCSICGYPLSLGEAEHAEANDDSDVDHEAATPQMNFKDSHEGPEVCSQLDTELLKSSEKGKLKNEVINEDINEKPSTGIKSRKSTSFFVELRKLVGGKSPSRPDDEEPEEQASHLHKEMKKGQINGEAADGVNEEDDTDSTKISVGEVDEDNENSQAFIENSINEVSEASDVVEDQSIRISEDSTSLANDIDPKLREVQEGLLQSISLELWLVNLLQEGGIDEDQFIKMFDEYDAQISNYLKNRDELLDQEREIESLKKRLSEAEVYLEELEMKRKIRKISEEEYRVKAPAFEWDINHYKNMISDYAKKLDFLEDLTKVMPKEEIIGIKANIEKCKWDLDNQGQSGNITTETTGRVKVSLERTLDFLEKFKVNY